MNQGLALNHLKLLASLNRKKNRVENGKVVVEGLRTIRQLLDNGIQPEQLYITEAKPDYDCIIRSMPADSCYQLRDRDFSRISETQAPQGIAALYPIREIPIVQKDFLIFLDNVSDPGNLGTIFRTAAAAGVDGIILSPECCERTNPKVIRSSLGASMSLPSEIRESLWLKESATEILVADMDGEDIFTISNLACPIILVIGSEAHGISPEVRRLASRNVRIPMTTKMESLNAAVSSAILIYEIQRITNRLTK